jgi:hypothetical protein
VIEKLLKQGVYFPRWAAEPKKIIAIIIIIIIIISAIYFQPGSLRFGY